MSCYSCGGNPNTFCGECLTNKDTWITLVDTLPDTFMGDLDHLFRTPDGNLYALSPDRTRWIRVNGEAGLDYKAGNGISISSDGTISNTQPNENQTLSFNNRTLSISGGNSVVLPSEKQELSINDRTLSITGGGSITLPEDHDTVYDDTDVKRRLQSLEGKTDNFVSNVILNREGNKITITYTFVNGDTKKVEFEDKDTIGVAYDDSALKARVKALENKPDKDTVYNDADLKRRVTALENKPTPTVPTYDDSGVLRRLGALEAKPDNDRQTLSYNNGSGVLSISGGNSVTIPKDNQPVIRIAKSNISGDAVPGSVQTTYTDNFLNKSGVKVGDIVQDIKYYANSGATEANYWTVSAVNGSDVTLTFATKRSFGNTRQTISLNGRTLTLSNGGSVDLNSLRQPVHRFYVGDIPGRADATNTPTIQKENILNNDDLRVGDTIEDHYSNSNTTNRGIWKITEISGDNVKVKGIGNYDINQRQTLTLNGNTITLSNNGGSVTIPQPNLSGYVPVAEYNKVKGALEKLLTNLKTSGAWKQTGSTVFEGELYGNRHIATGNINVFGGAPDGNSFIRTSNNKTENDLAGG